MNIQDFRLFLEVVEAGSLTKVAAQRHTAQSYISRQVSELEKQCGGALFRRTGRGVVLTEFGESVERRVRIWIRDSEEMFADFQQLSRVPMGDVKIGILPSAAHPLMTQVFSELRRSFPQIRLNVREGQGGELDAMLDTGAVDMAILFRYEPPRGQEEILLATADTYLVSRPGLPLTQAGTVSFQQLDGLPLVLPRRPSHWRSILDESARSQGFSLQAVIEADSLRMQKEILAENNDLYALLGPFAVQEELRSGKLQAAKIIDPDLKRYVTLALPKQGQLTQALRVVSKIIRDKGAVLAYNQNATDPG
ncbi:MAG: LysR family transcriptional regulator [Curvibacter lanceolatus]|jgi:DNA-binding transcriptional LysR family regulator|uniref:LysR family transcriptional regulator n=1 Tax=Curvibacter lanceolatus TaxID=86182 RepID=UPI002353EAC7|nr:LysR family transcriptional regulator [Curvibacter lanceolatus]MBV5291460.1 LysR family transcriptional regulator [Curvibacter lanceolatus]